MAYSKQCGICIEDYADEEDRKPRMLPCGHSYCHECLEQLEDEGRTCPTCRRDWSHCKLEDLPVCFQLLPESYDHLQPAERCSRHKSALTFACRTCKREICRKCVVGSHEHCACTVLEKCVDILRVEILDDFDKQETACNTLLALAEKRLGQVSNERLNVKQLMESLVGYDKSLLNHQKQIEEIEEEIKKDILVIEEKRSSIMNENSENLTACVYDKFDLPRTKQIENLTKTNLSIMVDAYSSVYDETPVENFVSSLENRLKDSRVETANHEKNKYFRDKDNWEVDSCSAAQSCLDLLKSTSFRPSSVEVTVDVPWARSTLETFLSTIATQTCNLKLNFLDTLSTPTSENAVENELRLKCLKIENRRCVLRKFVGHVSEDVGKVLLDILTDEVFDLTMVLKQSHHLSALRLITTNSRYRNRNIVHIRGFIPEDANKMELCIPRDADVTSFTELPPLTGSDKYTLCFPRLGNNDLCKMLAVVNVLNQSSLVKVIKLPDSNLTESGLDRFLGHLLDHSISGGLPTLVVESKSINPNAQNRIDIRYAAKKYIGFFKWENNDDDNSSSDEEVENLSVNTVRVW